MKFEFIWKLCWYCARATIWILENSVMRLWICINRKNEIIFFWMFPYYIVISDCGWTFSLVVNRICVNMFFICHFKQIKFLLNVIWFGKMSCCSWLFVKTHSVCCDVVFEGPFASQTLTGIWILTDIFHTNIQMFLLESRLMWIQICFLVILDFSLYFFTITSSWP